MPNLFLEISKLYNKTVSKYFLFHFPFSYSLFLPFFSDAVWYYHMSWVLLWAARLFKYLVLCVRFLSKDGLKCGFLKKPFIMNDFWRNPHFTYNFFFHFVQKIPFMGIFSSWTSFLRADIIQGRVFLRKHGQIQKDKLNQRENCVFSFQRFMNSLVYEI